MGRRTSMIAFSLVGAACLAASSIGCCCPRRCGGCGPLMGGYADNGAQGECAPENDRYAARPYRRGPCCRPRRDPRIPGPRVVSTLAPAECEAPGYFSPVPTYPVFGPRSEEPDGIEPELQPLSPNGMDRMEGEPLPAPPQNSSVDEDAAADDEISTDEGSDLQLAAPQQRVKHAGWKPAKRRAAEVEQTIRSTAKTSVTFKPRRSSSQ